MLAVIQTIRQSVAMYKATKQWRPNQYMQQLTADGILYFFVYVYRLSFYHVRVPGQKLTSWIFFPTRNAFLNVVIILQNVPNETSTVIFFLFMVSFITIIPMTPRFIISVRELYDRDTRGQRRQGIDTGFGVLSQPTNSANMVVSAIAFANVSPGQGEDDLEDAEAVGVEVAGGHTHRARECDAEDSDAIQLERLRDGARQV